MLDYLVAVKGSIKLFVCFCFFVEGIYYPEMFSHPNWYLGESNYMFFNLFLPNYFKKKGPLKMPQPLKPK